MTPAQDLSAAGAISEKTTQFGSLAEIESQTTIPATGNPNLFPSFASQNFPDFFPPNQLFNFTSAPPVATNVLAFQPNHNSPLLSNPASQSPAINCLPQPVKSSIPTNPTAQTSQNPILPTPSNPSPNAPTLAEKLRVRVKVDYPWLPPTCSHCHELGHVVRNCFSYDPSKDPSLQASDAAASGSKQRKKGSVTTKRTPSTTVKNKQYVVKKNVPPAPIATPPPPSVSLPSSPTAGKTSHFVLTPNHNHKSFHPPTQSPSDKPQKPSLKRSRSSPTFSPPAPPKITFQSS
ncbi:unnamed protein product, partial [Brassica napus]